MNHFVKIFLSWLPIATGIVGLSYLVYFSIQQNYRASLNDPQIETAENAAKRLQEGAAVKEIVSENRMIDAGQSLSPFVAIYDNSGNPIESSATIGGMPPKPPFGVFENAKKIGENRVTWQPSPDTRIALVVVPVQNNSGYFVASGRNMREIENRIAIFGTETMSGAIFILIATFVIQTISYFLFFKNSL